MPRRRDVTGEDGLHAQLQHRAGQRIPGDRSRVGRRAAMLSVRPVDNCKHAGTMRDIGREDRALLRSNPSARTDAGTGAGAYSHGGSRSPSLFWPQSDKPWGFGGKAPKTNPPAVCQLSRSSGLDRWLGAGFRGRRPPAADLPTATVYQPYRLGASPSGRTHRHRRSGWRHLCRTTRRAAP